LLVGVALLPAASPVAAAALADPDPIFAVIDRHRAASIAHKEAVRAEFAYEKNRSEREAMEPEEREKYKCAFCQLQAATSDASDEQEDAGVDLLNTKPTTLAGILALCRYVEPLFNEMDAPELPEAIYWDDDTQSTSAGAFANVIAAAVKAMLGGAVS
jgi:hypothetical protein